MMLVEGRLCIEFEESGLRKSGLYMTMQVGSRYDGQNRIPRPQALRTKRYWTSSDGLRSNDKNVILKHVFGNSDFERKYRMYRILTNNKIPYIGRILDSGGIRQYCPNPHMRFFEGNQTLVLLLYTSFPEVLSQASFMRYLGTTLMTRVGCQ